MSLHAIQNSSFSHLQNEIGHALESDTVITALMHVTICSH